MLQHAIDKHPRLHTVGQVADVAGLLETVEQTDPQWVLVSLSPEGDMPEAADTVLRRHSTVRVLGMTIDGSQAKVMRIPMHEKSLGSLSLRGLIAILVGDRTGESIRRDVRRRGDY
jgi:hypothetical protein